MVTTAPPLAWQPGLLGGDTVTLAPVPWTVHRTDLGHGAWLDRGPDLVSGAASLFDEVLAAAPWASHERPMYERMVLEPRLTTGLWRWPTASVLGIAAGLSEHYGTELSAISANLYRTGSDSVAWHGDRVGRRTTHTIVAIISLGSPRRFLMRPKGGGTSLRLTPGPGDLLAMGGTCQRTWEHAVPKCSSAGPRISLMFREPLSIER
jgi:alkylated DNA repair dioxygenase AlkB